MRHRIAVIGTSECTRSVALLLVARDDGDVLLTGEDSDGLRGAAASLDVEPRITGPVGGTGLTAVDVVVVCEGEDVPVDELRRRCPDALLVVASRRPAADAFALQESLLWPRQRVIGIDADAARGPQVQRAAAAVRLVDHVLADRRRSVPATVQTTAEGGEDRWASVTVTLGGDGVLAIEAPVPVPVAG